MTTFTPARRMITLLAALVLIATVFVLDRAPTVSAGPTPPATYDVGGVGSPFKITRTVSEATPTYGQVVTVRTEVMRESGGYLLYRVRDFTPTCLEYVPNSARWQATGGDVASEATAADEFSRTSEYVQFANGGGVTAKPFWITAEYTVKCDATQPGTGLNTGGTWIKRAPGGNDELGNKTMGPQIAVQQIQSEVELTATPNSVSVGEPVSLAAGTSGIPDGHELELLVNGTPSGTTTVNAGSASFSDWTPTATGDFTLAARYAGSTNVAGSTSQDVTVHVGKIATRVNLEVGSPAHTGSAIPLTATTTGIPDGQPVEFVVNGDVQGVADVAGGTATYTGWIPERTGDYPVEARFVATDTHAFSTSGTRMVSVATPTQQTSTALAVYPAPVAGEVSQLIATVHEGNDGDTVDFTHYGTQIGEGTVVDGVATADWDVPIELAGQDYSIVARYRGSEGYAPSSSTPVTGTVGKSLTHVSTVEATVHGEVNSQVRLSATITGAADGGEVVFRDATDAELCSVTKGSGATASCFWTPTATGAYEITAHYMGTESAAAASSAAPTAVTIGTAASSIELSGPGSVKPGQAAELTITTVGIADGQQIGIMVGTNTVDTVTVNGDQAMYEWTPAEAGAYVLKAVYEGSETVSPSESDELTITVDASATQTSRVSASTAAIAGQPVTLSATVTDGTGGATVEFRDGEALLCEGILKVDGTVECDWTPLSVGTVNVIAYYPGDAATVPSKSPRATAVAVDKAASTVSLDATSPVGVGGEVTFTVTTTGIANGDTIDITVGDTVIGSPTVTDNQAKYTWTAPATAGTVTAVAGYAGTDFVAASESTPVTIDVTAAGTTTSDVTASPDVRVGQDVVLSVTVAGGTPGVAVEFRNGDSELCTGTLAADGTVECNWTPAAAGTVNVTAHYQGDDATSASQSANATTIAVGTAASSVSLTGPGSVQPGQATELSVNAIGIADGQQIDIVVDGTTVDAVTVISGEAAYSWTPVEVGTYVIKAVYGGSETVSPAESDELTITVDAAATQTSLVTASADPTVGEPVTLSATVTGGSENSLVEFRDGSTFLCSARLTDDGAATCDWTPTEAGAINVTAYYAGDATTHHSQSPTATAIAVAEAPDTEAPAAPTGVTVSPQPATVGETVTVTGSAEADTTVSVKVGGEEVCEITATDGTFTCTFTATEEMDGQQVTVTATDEAGNTSTAADGGALEVQPEAVDPTEPIITLTPAQPVAGEKAEIEITGDAGEEVVIVSGDRELCRVTLDEDGTATCEWTPDAEGQVVLTVTVGDQTVEKTVTVRPADDDGDDGDEGGDDNDGSGSLDSGSLGSLIGGTGGTSGSLGSLSSLGG
ncbi:Ig-like domain repeat protein [Dietzia sp. NPDC055877]